MANTITNVTPQLLAQGLLALRQRAIMPRLVNRSYDTMAAQKGNVINVPAPSSITARSITPSETINSNVDSSPTTVALTLDWWYEAPFQMSDNDAKSVIDGFIPMQASEAVKALANGIDDYILGKHIGIFSAAGAAGTTPFATNLAVAASARVLLNGQLAPPDDRRGVLDAAAEGNLLTVADVLNFDKRGDQGGIINGSIGRKLGVDWYMDQNMPSYTPGTSWLTGWAVAGTGTIGASTLTVVNASVTVMAQIKVGDIFALAGQQYAITTAHTTVSVTDGAAIVFYPALKAAVASDAAITVIATAYTANLMFHRDAFSWASRPLAGLQGLGHVFQSQVDPVSGIALRLELSRQYKQTTFSFDVLGGAALIRKELATKILG